MTDVNLKEKNGEHPFGDAGQIILLALFLIVWVADSFFLHLTTHLAAGVPLLLRLAVALLAGGLGFALIKSAHFIVEPDTRPDEVVSSGAFKYLRHPVYAAALLVYLALTVSTLSLICVGLFLIAFLFYNFIAGYEEKLLIAKFGDDYREYIKRTARWLPKL